MSRILNLWLLSLWIIKIRYDQQINLEKLKKSTHRSSQKIRLSPTIDKHDFELKANIKVLGKGDKS